jgi:DNA-directed RNA polymerase specialized sigma24 family protein
MNTAIVIPSALESVRIALADDGIRRRIEEIVRRRVGAQEVGDVVQSVVHAALSAPEAPPDADVPRWLFGIARHKVADHHRSARRSHGVGVDPALVAAPAAPLEARSLLRRVIGDAARDPRHAQTMGWIAREAQGEQLEEMAREAALPAATVRQRVSRLRRWLQRRWREEALLVAVAAVAMLAFALRRGPVAVVEPIVPDPMGDSRAAASASLQGHWRVVRVDADASLDAARRALLAADAASTVVDVDGPRVRFASPSRRGERRLETGPVVDGRFEVRVVDGGGRVQRATAHFDDHGRLVVVSTDGDWRGSTVLER